MQTLSEKAKTGVQELGQKAPAGMGGLVGAGILGAVLGIVLPKGTIKTAGLAGLVAVAWNFYQKWTLRSKGEITPPFNRIES